MLWFRVHVNLNYQNVTISYHQFVQRQGRIYLLVNHAVISSMYQFKSSESDYILSPIRPKTRSDIPFTCINSSKDKVGYTFQLHQFVLRQGRIYLLLNHAVISTVVTINLNYQNLDISYIHQFVLRQGRIYLSFAPIRPKTRSDIPFC